MQDHEFILQQSKTFLFISTALVLASMAILTCIAMDVVLKLCLLTLVGAYSIGILRQHVLMQGQHAIVAIRRASEGRWYISTRHRSDLVSLLGDSTVTNFMMILRFRMSGSFWPCACVIFPDALAPDLYRRLLVTLKTEKIQ